MLNELIHSEHLFNIIIIIIINAIYRAHAANVLIPC